MTFLNPLGLLALLAIPVILGLHFFRQQKRSRQVGGLHLWDFARIATPAGRRFERLLASLPLLFQLLAAILLALLLAGLDIPTEQSARHYAVIIDDSVSMQARVNGGTSAQRAIDALTDWAADSDKFTLVAASDRPVVLAGPAASKQEFLQALSQWTPRSPVANLDEAVNIAGKFGTDNSRILLISDNPDSADYLKQSVTVWGVGRAAPNNAIVFADRFRASKESDKIVATVQRYGGATERNTLTVYSGETALATRQLDLETSKPVSVEMELPTTAGPLRLSLKSDDPLAADDSVILAPVSMKPVKVFVADNLPNHDAFTKAASAVDDVLFAPTVAESDLFFTTDAATSSATADAQPRRTYRFAGAESTGSLRMASGRDLVIAEQSPIARNVSLAGVIWPFDGAAPGGASAALRADISYTSIPLLYVERDIDNARVYRVNLDLNSTNIYRHTAWPVLLMNMIEECRSALPGFSRVNLRAGEELRMNLEPPKAGRDVFTLWREGEPTPRQTWRGEPPRVLSGLAPGTYHVRQGAEVDSPELGMFRVNLFSQGESDLRPLKTVKPDLEKLTAEDTRHTERNFLLYYAMLIALMGCVVLGWMYHDAGH